jgi:glycosyltransferase involved in cell wall biosynthesis
MQPKEQPPSTRNEPLVSIVIPFLNPGSWLAEAIESVIRQTYSNWELILVDDGSVEQDAALALAYANNAPGKITYMEHDGHVNRGLTASRNAGIARARGGFVAFLDADDCWLPNKLTHQVEIFNQFAEVQMICEASLFWYSWKTSDEKDNAREVKTHNVQDKDYLQEIGAEAGIYQPTQLMELLYPLGEGQPPCPSGIIITKDALQRAGGFETKFSGIYQLYEDQAFLSKVYAREVVFISNQANNKYRKRPNSMSSAASDEVLYRKVRLFYLEWLEQYFLKESSSDPRIEKLIARFRQKLEA